MASCVRSETVVPPTFMVPVIVPTLNGPTMSLACGAADSSRTVTVTVGRVTPSASVKPSGKPSAGVNT
ncbi:hypothetical protein [Desulfitobacterium sp. LBE]|uniref:hypothetical protein n=1 Tax=Desulfitobacterium sp. LBE TaxID=884086 RepID=UPI00155AD6AE|nr:hypothetical protein [Desulfitobacterium sp. LBE]